jgi:hypothetical protein
MPETIFLQRSTNMSGFIDGNGDGTRREFLRGAQIATAGALLSAGAVAARAQEQPAPPTKRPDGTRHHVRASAPAETRLSQLGPLRELPGTWIGRGFDLISLPDFDNPPPDGPKPFRLKLNATVEVLEFQNIGGNVPNRGSTGQNDINLFGVTYLQRISDLASNGALHIEPGLWLHVPATTVPLAPATVVRQGSIPHGVSVLAQGAALARSHGGPKIQPVDPTPFDASGPITNPEYLLPFSTAVAPPGAQPSYLKNPNQALLDAISDQTITHTQVLDISTVTGGAPLFQGGGLLNIPFLTSNANVTQFSSIFWIETVRQPDGTHFMQLQYTQTVILNFLNINWPHISVATLVKQ